MSESVEEGFYVEEQEIWRVGGHNRFSQRMTVPLRRVSIRGDRGQADNARVRKISGGSLLPARQFEGGRCVSSSSRTRESGRVKEGLDP